ncbi:Hypothetical predicted protein [Octopus vulgaris]|uniref:Uncharacterized protein n=1 Tax=Octopus vulgaris TaxID=6645 RepID=A0AA36BWC0_OCTVU|nr:Hypothetical predicted protein [Octopus vulgaris]
MKSTDNAVTNPLISVGKQMLRHRPSIAQNYLNANGDRDGVKEIDSCGCGVKAVGVVIRVCMVEVGGNQRHVGGGVGSDVDGTSCEEEAVIHYSIFNSCD